MDRTNLFYATVIIACVAGLLFVGILITESQNVERRRNEFCVENGYEQAYASTLEHLARSHAEWIEITIGTETELFILCARRKIVDGKLVSEIDWLLYNGTEDLT